MHWLQTPKPHILSLTPAFSRCPSEEWASAVSTAYDPIIMSVHSYSRCWVHLIWATLNRERVLNKRAAASVSCFLEEYADKKGHLPQSKLCECRSVHALIDLPTAFSIEKVVQLLKGSSSHWINSNHIIAGKFAWGRGYGAFSISHSNVDVLMRYIADQEEHHRQRTFTEEWREFIDRHGLRWRDEERR